VSPLCLHPEHGIPLLYPDLDTPLAGGTQLTPASNVLILYV
jgi:hypothetical protein